MKTQQVDKVRLAIRSQLNMLNSVIYPTITEMIKTEAGYKQIEQQIIAYAAKNNVDIQNAIAHLESNL